MAKQKLELQVNIPTTIRLLQAEPATGENNYGKWFLYNVECQGSEYSYFAPEKVVELLKANNVSQDEEVVITKKLVKNGKKNLVDYEVHVLDTAESVETNPYPVVKTSGHTNGTVNGSNTGIAVTQNGQLTHNNGNGNIQTITEQPSTFSKDYSVMLQCMTEAMLIRDELGHDIDVNKLGITLFLRKVNPNR